ncbi:MAG: molybdate ABC transporter substrate-binding protein [Burkholderiales bacterium]|nr:molybdate ABC transporter substrate-binding protein [Burkholderiales bacterium]
MRIRLFLLALILCCAQSMAADVPVAAAASDLQFALQEVATAFTKQSGRQVKLVFGSSGNFRRQIAEGAPFELFLSADESYVLALAKEGKTLDNGVLYAIGRIALIAPNDSPLKPDAELKDLTAALADGRIRKFAIANPEHAPYGRAAQQALTKAGLWDKIKPALVLGENVSQAAQFATSGSAQGGIVAYAQVLSPTIAKLGTYALIPAEWHEPLQQRMVLTKNAGDAAKLFYQYLQSAPARAIFKRYGFALPGE